MDIDFTKEERNFQREVLEFLETNIDSRTRVKV